MQALIAIPDNRKQPGRCERFRKPHCPASIRSRRSSRSSIFCYVIPNPVEIVPRGHPGNAEGVIRDLAKHRAVPVARPRISRPGALSGVTMRNYSTGFGIRGTSLGGGLGCRRRLEATSRVKKAFVLPTAAIMLNADMVNARISCFLMAHFCEIFPVFATISTFQKPR